MNYKKKILIVFLTSSITLLLIVFKNQQVIAGYKKEIALIALNLICIVLIMINFKAIIVERRLVKTGNTRLTPLLTEFIMKFPHFGGVMLYGIYIILNIIPDYPDRIFEANFSLGIAVLALMMSRTYIRITNVLIGEKSIYIDRMRIDDFDIQSIKESKSKSEWKQFEIIIKDHSARIILLNKKGYEVFVNKYKEVIQ